MQPIVDFADELMLRERLARAFPEGRGRVPSVAVGFAQEGRAAFACTKSASSALPAQCAQATRGAPAAALALHAGCLTKLFTAALAAQACAEGRVALDERLAPALSLPRGPAFEGITLRHLLEHTHGLDDSAVAAVPLRKDGRIDAAALGRRLSEAPPLAEPGRLYSYSNAGAWLIAAWLERTSGQTYGRLLHERILAPLRDTGARAEALDTRGGLCPATGGALKVSLRTVLRFLAAHSPRDVLHGDRSGSRRVTPLPGWNALERGVYLGWKYHGEGWLGHQSVWPEISALVRVQAQAGLALVVACRSVPAAIAAAKLFGT
ncbi:MAG TPA: serine hydrolase domain-containing protein, partial [Gammaproteobacteria bacterium]|nr:serine hydrolase domain-containing protein [Gammaproteobacteria bacterium]